MPVIALKDIDLYYELHGQGPPMLLIAGLASDSQSWLPATAALSQHFRVITFDNRGVGRTVPMDVPVSVKMMAADCVELIKHLQFEKVHVLGHSLGGLVAMELAVSHPERVDKLILEATVSMLSGRNRALFGDWIFLLSSEMSDAYWFRNLFYWIFSPAFFENSLWLETAVQSAIHYPYPQTREACIRQIQSAMEVDIHQSLGRIKSQTLVLTGQYDLLFSTEEVEALVNQIPKASGQQIKDAAHAIHLENPLDFTEAIIAFLDKS